MGKYSAEFLVIVGVFRKGGDMEVIFWDVGFFYDFDIFLYYVVLEDVGKFIKLREIRNKYVIYILDRVMGVSDRR